MSPGLYATSNGLLRTIAVLSCLATVACGGGPDVSEDRGTTSLPVLDAVVSMSEWRFGPTEVRLSGDEATLQLRNDGSILHEWALLSSPVVREAELTEDRIIARKAVSAGRVELVTFSLPEPGVYQVVCPIPGHIAEGMVGSLIVEG